MSGQTGRQGGFTLIEILVVLAILGLMGGLLLTRGSLRSPRVEARGTATRLLQGLRATRAQAIARDQPVLFAVDGPRHLFRVGDQPPQPIPPAIRVTVQSGGQPARGIVFTPEGTSPGGSIVLADARLRMALTVDWLTGRITVADLPMP